MKQPTNTLLKVVSIIMIVFGSIGLLVGLIGLLGGAAIAGLGAAAGEAGTGAALGGAVVGLTLVACLGSILEFIGGIMGVRANNLNACKIIAIIIIVIQLLSVIFNCIGSSNGGVGTAIVGGIIGLILPVLYLLGVKKQKEING